MDHVGVVSVNGLRSELSVQKGYNNHLEQFEIEKFRKQHLENPGKSYVCKDMIRYVKYTNLVFHSTNLQLLYRFPNQSLYPGKDCMGSLIQLLYLERD